MIIDNDTIEHYGVKGMHWGQRKARSASKGESKSSEKEPKKKLSSDQKKLLAIGGVVAIAAGGIIAHHILSQNKGAKVSSLNNVRSASEIKRIQSLMNLNEVLKTPMNRVSKPGPIPMGPVGKQRQKLKEDINLMGTARLKKRGSEQATIDLLKKRHTELNRSANGDLKKWYERSQTPLHLRNYLDRDPYGRGD